MEQLEASMDVEDQNTCAIKNFYKEANYQMLNHIQELKKANASSSNTAINIFFSKCKKGRPSFKSELEDKINKNEFECGGCSVIFSVTDLMFLEGLICGSCSSCYCKLCAEYLINNHLECEHN